MKKNKDNNIYDQEIMVIGTKFFERLERFNVFIHILAILLIVVSLIVSETSIVEYMKIILDTLTLVVIFLILIIYFINPVIKKFIIMSMLGNFWGTVQVETRISHSTIINPAEGKIDEQKDFFNKERVWIGFERYGFLNLRKRLKAKTYFETNPEFVSWADDNGVVDVNIRPLQIIVDLKEKYIKFISKTDINNSGAVIVFHTRDRIVKWSGILPDNPFFGEWKWIDENSKESYSKFRGLLYLKFNKKKKK